MLVLRAIGPGGGLPSQSPFVMKAMGYLHVLGFEWQVDTKADIRKQPNGKLPVLVDRDKVIPDSGAIARYLQEKAGRWLDDGLGGRDKMFSHALVRMAEEHLYFLVVWNRWSVDENFAVIRADLEKIAPFPMSKILPGVIRKGVIKLVKAQGIGRMSDALRLERFQADLDVLERALGGKDWLFDGDGPRTADLSVAPLIAALIKSTADTAMRRDIMARTTLVAYGERALAEAFPAPDALPYPVR